MQSAAYWASAGLILTAILAILRLVVRRDYLRNGRLTPFSSAMEWLMAMLWAAWSYYFIPADWPEIRVIPLMQWAGWACVVGSVPIMLGSMAWLGLRRTHGLDAEILIRSGPYRLTRNPQIIGFGLGMAGFFLLWPSWHMVVSVCLLVVLVHVMVITEEEHLLDRHGDQYREYCANVPRYLGIPRGNPVAGADSALDNSGSNAVWGGEADA